MNLYLAAPPEQVRMQQMMQRIKSLKEQIQYNASQGNVQANQALAVELQQLLARAQQMMSMSQRAGVNPNADKLRKKRNLQLQTDLFIKTLLEYQKSQNQGQTPFSLQELSGPIEGKPVNPLMLYMLVAQIKGPQGTGSISWEQTATKMGYSVAAASQLRAYYARYIAAFDSYLKSPEGQQHLESNKRQKMMEIQGRASPATQPAMVNASPATLPAVLAATPKTETLSPNTSTSKENNDGTYYRVYEPSLRPLTNVGGIPLAELDPTGLSEQLNKLKPNYLYTLEIGQINVHALVMALQSGNISDATNVLNMVLVVLLDQKMEINVAECPELPDRLCELGLAILDELVYDQPDDAVLNEDIYTEREGDHKGKPRKKRLYKSQSYEVPRVDQIFAMDRYYHPEIDIPAFEAMAQDYTELTFTVDSFTGEIVDDKQEKVETLRDDISYYKHNMLLTPDRFAQLVEQDSIFKLDQQDPYKLELHIERVKSVHLPQYMELLKLCGDEMSTPFHRVNERASENYQLMLIDQLSTLTMIARNLSALPANAKILGSLTVLRRFLCKTIFTCFAHSKALLYLRRRLLILKDCLLTLCNIGAYLRLADFHDAFCIVILALLFGDLPEKDRVSPLYISGMHRYQAHAVDMLAKIMASCKENRYLMRCVLIGRYEKYTSAGVKKYYTKDRRIEDSDDGDDDFIEDKAFYNALGFEGDTIDLKKTPFEYLKKYLEAYNETPELCALLRRVFGLAVSIIPSHSHDAARFEERAAGILQAFLTATLAAKFIPIDTLVDENIALDWLSLQESVGSNFLRIGLGLPAVRPQNRVYAFIAVRSLAALNALLGKVFSYFDMQAAAGRSRDEGCRRLALLPRIFPPPETILGSYLLAPGVDPQAMQEAMKLEDFASRLASVLKEIS